MKELTKTDVIDCFYQSMSLLHRSHIHITSITVDEDTYEILESEAINPKKGDDLCLYGPSGKIWIVK